MRPSQGILAATLLASCTGAVLGQAANLPPAPVPVSGGSPAALDPPPSTPGGPPVRLTPPPSPLLQPMYAIDDGGPIAVTAIQPLPRLVAGVDVELAFPQLSHWLLNDGSGFHMPKARPDATVSPRLSLGYVFDDGGAAVVSYRFLIADGHQEQVFNGTSRQVGGRIEDHVVDLDYVTRECPALWESRVQVDAGARLASVFLRNDMSTDSGDLRWSNNFFGAGLHGGIGVSRALGETGLVLFGKADGGLLIGEGKQEFTFDDGSGPAGPWARGPELVPTLNLEAGLSWTWTGSGYWLRVTGGYQFEEWWFVPTGAHAADWMFRDIHLLDHGPFARCEFRF